ncbi:MAG TPA: hypothetical protein VMA77_12495 [Solirubrobacteraceae bacterium]|nr:hypothetical protein [Solirubrobacteraceae bacterium]
MTRAAESSEGRYGWWLGACGVAGPILLALYFGIPSLVPRLGSLVDSAGTPSTSKIVTVGADYHLLLSIGCWVQGTGALLCVVFLLGLAQRSGGGSSLPGRILLLGCTALVGLVLAEMVFTFTWASTAAHGQPSSARAAYDLMARFVQVFPIVPAPTVYLALAAVLAAGRPILPAVFTRLAAFIGIGFFLIGLAAALTPDATAAAGGLAALQSLWILAAGIAALRSPNVTVAAG